MTYIDDVPFHQVGKGEQCLIKTNLALAHKKAQTSNLILIEEPENHLSHTRLNELLETITSKCEDKQLIITTHSNFVANKLSLQNLVLLSSQKTTRFTDLSKEDAEYFQKLPGYDTLRLILANSAILVEGPSDELIVQRAYRDNYGTLPIQQGIDVISVRGLSFKRFLEIAKRLNKKVAVVTDNDGKYEHKIKEKYKDFDSVPCLLVCAIVDNTLKTLEHQFVRVNTTRLSDLRTVLDIKETEYPAEKDVSDYMEANKTEWALNVFQSDKTFEYPAYILKAIDWVHEGE
jgi:putative ATP-dependent endonuclease of OLD family